jgi:SAM-dependent methyltransferase
MLRKIHATAKYRLGVFQLYRRNRQFAVHDVRRVFEPAARTLERLCGQPLHQARILEIGCGQRFGATLLFTSVGARAVGIDSRTLVTKWTPGRVWEAARNDGVGPTARACLRHLLWDREYYSVLESELGHPLRFDRLDLRRMDATSLEFDDCSFDFVFSNAVFEHISDIDAAIGEVARVLAPGGAAQIGVHLYPSLSGGHSPDWAYPDDEPSTATPPWDHLRQRLRPPSVYLNQLREAEYLEAFSKHLDVLNVESVYEGRDLLTDEIAEELSAFSRDDLLKRRITVTLTKADEPPREARQTPRSRPVSPEGARRTAARCRGPAGRW